MSKTSTDQYGRKTWNTEEYEKEASRKRAREVPPEALEAQNKLRDKTLLAQRTALLDLSVLAVGKHTLIGSEGAGGGIRGKNKRFGFACPVCDLSFRDTLALVDHFNSPQHLSNISKSSGDSGTERLQDGVQRASLEQVSRALEELVKALLSKKVRDESLSLQERVTRRLEFEKRRAQRRREKKRRRRTGAEPESLEVAALMGFGGFASTKGG